MSNPYGRWVKQWVALFRKGRQLPLGGFGPDGTPPPLRRDAPVALIFSPHPDDECITGALALRLRWEGAARVINVAVTLGSRVGRRVARWRELRAACRHLGFETVRTAPAGLSGINLHARREQPKQWRASVETIRGVMAAHEPRVIILPHPRDWNSTHEGTHALVRDALKTMPRSFACVTVETEYWAPMERPNLLVESSAAEVALLLAALSCHRGEVERNPYHLSLPAWMADNVRRGSELVQGQGHAAVGFVFGTLYRRGLWRRGQYKAIKGQGLALSAREHAERVLTM